MRERTKKYREREEREREEQNPERERKRSKERASARVPIRSPTTFRNFLGAETRQRVRAPERRARKVQVAIPVFTGAIYTQGKGKDARRMGICIGGLGLGRRTCPWRFELGRHRH